MMEIFNGRDITFLSSLGGVSVLQVLHSEDKEESGSSYHPGIHLFMKYFNYTSNLYNKYNHINFNWFTVGTETEEMDTESESFVTDTELPDEGEGNGDKVDAMEEMGDG